MALRGVHRACRAATGHRRAEPHPAAFGGHLRRALCGASPIPASGGKTNRYRLNRGGDRAANRTLHMIAVVRMRWCPATRAYVQRRTAQGMSKRDIIRCLKRYGARAAYTAIQQDLANLAKHAPPRT